MKKGKLEGDQKRKNENRMGAGKHRKIMKEIKEKAQNDDPRNIAMFMPGKVKELQEAIDRKDKYSEQLDMLKCLMRNEEE